MIVRQDHDGAAEQRTREDAQARHSVRSFGGQERGCPSDMTRSVCLNDLASVISEMPPDHSRVAIDGVDGVGKTTLADELAPLLEQSGRGVIRASIDGFHLPRRIRYRRGPSSPEGYFHDSFDYEALKSTLLDPLGPGGSRRFRTAVFDHRKDAAIKATLRTAKPGQILLFDGVFLLRPELERYWDLAIWLEAPFEVTVERAVQRDVSTGSKETAIRDRYEHRYVPGQRVYLTQCRPKERADIVFTNTDISYPEVEYR